MPQRGSEVLEDVGHGARVKRVALDERPGHRDARLSAHELAHRVLDLASRGPAWTSTHLAHAPQRSNGRRRARGGASVQPPRRPCAVPFASGGPIVAVPSVSVRVDPR